MPPKNRKNKKGNKKEDDTPVNNDQEQSTFQAATEEEKTEEQVGQTETTQAETTQATEVTAPQQDESNQPQEEKIEVVPETEASQKVEVIEESQKPAEEQQVAENVNNEPEVAPAEEVKPEETVIESQPAAHEEPVKEHVPVPEESVQEPVQEPVQVAPVSQEEEKPVETEVKTNVESEVGVTHPSVQHEEVKEVVEEKVPEVATDAEELKKVEELVQHGTTEPENVSLYASKAPEHNEVLTTSIQSNWEQFENQPPAQEVSHNLSTSQVVVENPSVHVVVESEGKGIAGQAGSLQESWNVVENKEKAVEQEEARSDKANDNAVNTRLMDVDLVESVHVQKELAPAQVEAALTHNERLRRAEEHIRSAKTLEEQGKYGEAVNLLQSSKDLLNPDFFQGSEQAILEEVNKQILDCSLEIATCYDQLSDFNQSVKYARAILKTSPGNIQAVYLLGIGLIRRGDMEEARVVLKEAKESSGSEEDNKYVALINKELEKLEQIAESRTKVQRVSPLEEDLVVNREGSVHEKPQEKPEENKKENKTPSSGGASTEYFLGSLVSSSVLSFVIAKYILKFPTQRGILTSLVVGAVAGGVSLLAQRSSKQDKPRKD